MADPSLGVKLALPGAAGPWSLRLSLVIVPWAARPAN